MTASVRRTPDEVDLFLYSAATWLTHRIHFDRDHARREGFADLVVHGPLQGAYLAQWLAETAAEFGGRLSCMEYRHWRTAFVGETLTLAATVVDAGADTRVALTVTTHGSEPVTTGEAVLRFPTDAAAADWFAAVHERSPRV